MAPPIHLGAWSMALMLWLPFELLLLLLTLSITVGADMWEEFLPKPLPVWVLPGPHDRSMAPGQPGRHLRQEKNHSPDSARLRFDWTGVHTCDQFRYVCSVQTLVWAYQAGAGGHSVLPADRGGGNCKERLRDNPKPSVFHSRDMCAASVGILAA